MACTYAEGSQAIKTMIQIMNKFLATAYIFNRDEFNRDLFNSSILHLRVRPLSNELYYISNHLSFQTISSIDYDFIPYY